MKRSAFISILVMTAVLGHRIKRTDLKPSLSSLPSAKHVCSLTAMLTTAGGSALHDEALDMQPQARANNWQVFAAMLLMPHVGNTPSLHIAGIQRVSPLLVSSPTTQAQRPVFPASQQGATVSTTMRCREFQHAAASLSIKQSRSSRQMQRRELLCTLAAAMCGSLLALVKPVIADDAEPSTKELMSLRERNYNLELLKQIEALRDKRENLDIKLAEANQEKDKLKKEIAMRSARLKAIETLTANREKERSELVQDIAETETEMLKILQSSAALLKKVKSKKGD